MTKQQHIEQVSNRIEECKNLYCNYKKKYSISIISFLVLLTLVVTFFFVFIVVKRDLSIYDLILLIGAPLILACVGCIPIIKYSETIERLEIEIDTLQKVLGYYTIMMLE